jgi:hypothetical protein
MAGNATSSVHVDETPQPGTLFLPLSMPAKGIRYDSRRKGIQHRRHLDGNIEYALTARWPDYEFMEADEDQGSAFSTRYMFTEAPWT